MNISDFHEFLVLAEHGNFTQASAVLFTTQSTLSRHIQALENELGSPLFVRGTKKVTLTEYGELLLPYAQQIWGQYEAMSNLFSRKKQQISDNIKVYMGYPVGTLLKDYVASQQSYSVDINAGAQKYSDIQEMLSFGRCDLAFAYLPPSMAISFDSMLVRTDRMYALLPRTHPLAGADRIRLSALKDDSFVFLNGDNFESDFLQQQCIETGFVPRVVLRGGSGAYLANCVESGIGVTLLLSYCVDSLPGGNIVKLPVEDAASVERRVYYRKGARAIPAIKDLLSYISSVSYSFR